MGYLLLAILCSSSIALVFKYSEGQNLNRSAVTTTNYAAAFAVSLAMLVSRKAPIIGGSIEDFLKEVKSVIFLNETLFSSDASMLWAIIVGVIGGFFFFYSFIFYQKSVRTNGASISGAFGKMGVLLPLVLSLIFWKELPTLVQWLGIALSLAAILIVNIGTSSRKSLNVNMLLVGLLLLNGMAEFMNKLFQKYAVLMHKELFLFWVFFTAFIISAIYTSRQKRKVTLRDIKAGIMVGLPNLFSSYFLIMALDKIYASVAFPVFSAGTILFISLGSFILFGERLKRKEIFSIIMIVFSLILINI